MNRLLFFSLSVLLIFFIGCKPGDSKKTIEKTPEVKEKKLSLSVSNFDDSNASIFRLTNKNGIELVLTNYGCIIVSLKTPDRNGDLADIVLGFDNFSDYEKDGAHIGAIAGRYCNRIAGAKFSIDGEEFTLAKNDGENTLHGGIKGFNKRTWVFKTIEDENRVGVRFYRISPDGEEGFPGELKANVGYYLDNENNLTLEYEAITNKPTVLNLTNHAYFNLKGEGNGDILNHELRIFAEKYTPVDENMIPRGVEALAGTPLSFLDGTPIGERINEDHEQLKLGNGYDHNYVLKPSGEKPQLAAEVYEPTSGRTLEVYTNQPAIQLYTGNYLDGTIGKSGKSYIQRGGFCLETQHYPDSPNQPDFPSTVLRPGEKFKSTTIYKFGAAESSPSK